MKKENGYWVDKNGNKWNEIYYSKKEAKQYSATLIDCKNCTDCKNSVSIDSCEHCHDCINCIYCSYSYFCEKCSYCIYCCHSNCCNECNDCGYCRRCDKCKNCQRGYNYQNCNKNPEQYCTPEIGSRNSQTIFYINDSGINVICGCFRGNFKEFINRVDKTYPEENNKYRLEYLNEINKVKIIFSKYIPTDGQETTLVGVV